MLRVLYELTRRLEPYRPVFDASGFTYEITDIYDVHDYEQDVEIFSGHMQAAGTKKTGSMCLKWKNMRGSRPEKNGLYTYDRKPKFNLAWLAGVNSKRAAVEENE